MNDVVYELNSCVRNLELDVVQNISEGREFLWEFSHMIRSANIHNLFEDNSRPPLRRAFEDDI